MWPRVAHYKLEGRGLEMHGLKTRVAHYKLAGRGLEMHGLKTRGNIALSTLPVFFHISSGKYSLKSLKVI
jgi:hypothetical protein